MITVTHFNYKMRFFQEKHAGSSERDVPCPTVSEATIKICLWDRKLSHV